MAVSMRSSVATKSLTVVFELMNKPLIRSPSLRYASILAARAAISLPLPVQWAIQYAQAPFDMMSDPPTVGGASVPRGSNSGRGEPEPVSRMTLSLVFMEIFSKSAMAILLPL